jgi:hypothetical protein
MPCCGQKRNALKTNTSPSTSHSAVSHHWPTPRPAAVQSPVVPGHPTVGAYAITLEYTQKSTIVVEGSATHRLYQFSAASPVQMIDARDAASLLTTRFFVRR